MIDVRKFVYDNITPYQGDASFLSWPSDKTKKLWRKCKSLLKKEMANWWTLDVDSKTISNITSHKAWYLDQELETIVWRQTDKPLKRAIKPYGWRRVVAKACEEQWKKLDPRVVDIFSNYRKSHNDGVFDAYTDDMMHYRNVWIITWLPDNYARWRIIWDYRRLALYWADALIAAKKEDRKNLLWSMTDDLIRLREETTEQIRALEEIKKMAAWYWFDVSKPATTAKEAVQWVWFAFLSALKEQDGAAMSLWNVSSFLDIYIEKDMQAGAIDEQQAQELIDQFVIKLRLVRHLRMKAYDEIFAWDPTWITESIWWMFSDGKTKVTKTSFRFLHTLYNLGPAPEPNLTVLWSDRLPDGFKKFCSKVSIDTSSIQYENDDLMREVWCTDDYGIACCVSQLEIGKRMQFFGARCNGAKALLYSINEWKDEKTWDVVFPGIEKMTSDSSDGSDILDYNEVLNSYYKTLEILAKEYVNTMNVIHYMHDKYYYERAQMAFMDTKITRLMAFGIAWLSVAADSLSAIKYAKVKAIRDERWITKDFHIEWEFPKYWNDDDRVDMIAKDIVDRFMGELRKHHIYRGATPTLSILTITSNVMYGHKTWATPDGRKADEAFAPWANPMHGRDSKWAIASLNSVAKLDYKNARDWISNTFSIVPQSLWVGKKEEIANLAWLLDGYFKKWAHHLNVNVMNKDTLQKAMAHPEQYPQLTIRVSWYAVLFNRLSKEQQEEVISRTFHERM